MREDRNTSRPIDRIRRVPGSQFSRAYTASSKSVNTITGL
jgi:hypothetical protein